MDKRLKEGNIVTCRTWTGHLQSGVIIDVEPNGKNGKDVVSYELQDGSGDCYWCYTNQITSIREVNHG